jgi:hypothetical protein
VRDADQPSQGLEPATVDIRARLRVWAGSARTTAEGRPPSSADGERQVASKRDGGGCGSNVGTADADPRGTTMSTTTPTPPTVEPARTGSTARRDGRARRLVSAAAAVFLLAMFVLPGIPQLLGAWTSTLHEGTHLIHDLAHVSHTVLLFGPALAAILVGRGRGAPAHMLLATFLVPLPIAVGGGLLTPAQASLPAALMLLLVVLHRRPTAGTADVDVALPRWRPSPLLLSLAALLSVPLAVFATGQLRLQAALPLTEPHAALGHWTGMGFWAAAIGCLAVLVGLRTPRWRLPLYSGVTATALIAVGSITHPDLPSSFGVGGGLATLAAAAAFTATAEISDRRESRRPVP